MTYTVSRDGQPLGTYSEEGIQRQFSMGVLRETDLAFLEREQRWVPISELPKAPEIEVAEYTANMESATPRLIVTHTLAALNIAVFIAMLIGGVPFFDPKTTDLIRWGGDFAPLTTNGQWWRLLTAAFIHIGVVHLAFNMWVLLRAGLIETLFGNLSFLTLYLISAIGGSFASIVWQPLTVSAGASGAIFGIYGGLIGLLLVRRTSLPKAALTALTTNALVFVGYNLLYGLTDSHIDMAAHVGGLATGFVAGCALAYRSESSESARAMRRNAAVVAASLIVFLGAGWKLKGGDPKQAENYWSELGGHDLIVGSKDHIVYSGSVTDPDARRLADTLQENHFLADQGALVLYSRNASGPVISVIVKEEAWKDPRAGFAFRLLGMQAAQTTGRPLRVRLLSAKRETKSEFVIQ